jgi:cytochrome c oxidase cbb3-type subunit III
MLRDLIRRSHVPVLSLFLLGATLAYGQDQQIAAEKEKKPNPDVSFGGQKLDPAAVARGQKVFVPNCGFCHAADASGKSAPDLIRSQVALRDEGGNLIGPIIHNGRPDRGMPSFPNLTNEQIADISVFLHSRKQATANRFAYQIKGLLTGDPKAGEAYFNGPGKCSTCHSPTGDLAGIATRMDPTDLQHRFLAPGPSMMDAFLGKKSKPLPPSKVTLKLPSGQTVSGTLEHRDEWTIELRDSNGWHRSYSLEGAEVQIDDPMQFHYDQLRKYTDADMHNLLAYLETLK